MNHFLKHHIPPHWSVSNVFLLFKGGDPLLTKNYRPISLLHSISKLISTHLFDNLHSTTMQHFLLHPSQHGGLPGIRTTDHLLHLKSLRHTFPNSYHLYIDFNKAFYNIPIRPLLTLLVTYKLPRELIFAIRCLYTYTIERPLINGQVCGSHT